jgi:hypothetical protein
VAVPAAFVGGKQVKILVGDGILELLAQKTAGDQDVEIRRQDPGAGPFLEQADGPGVLLAAENELRFPLAAGHLLPGGHHGRHQDGGHAHAYEQGGHCVSFLTV